MPQTRRYMVVPTSKKRTLNLGDHQVQLGRNGASLSDGGQAAEIEQHYGEHGSGDVVVVPHYVDREPGHHYTFTVPELPWKKNKDGQK